MKPNEEARRLMIEVAGDVEALCNSSEALVALWRQVGRHLAAGDLLAALDVKARANQESIAGQRRARLVESGLERVCAADPVLVAEMKRSDPAPATPAVPPGLPPLVSLIQALLDGSPPSAPSIKVMTEQNASALISTLDAATVRRLLADHGTCDPANCSIGTLSRARLAELDRKSKP